MRRMLIISDLHCGHRAGLTPPGWQYNKNAANPTEQKYAEMQKYLWDWYGQTVEELKPIDFLLCNGDAIDGKGERSGGNEQITTDRDQQVMMAKECIELAEADKIVMIIGTGYHVGKMEDWERILARELGADIFNHKVLEIDGTELKIDAKHYVGRSNVYTNRTVAAFKEVLWGIIRADKKGFVKADIYIRSHNHYHVFSGDENQIAINTPALSGPGTNYGEKGASTIVDVGLIYIDAEENGDYTWKAKLIDMRPLMDEPLKL